MSWREREAGRDAFERGKYLHNNPHSNSFDAVYAERRSAREWEEGYREAKRHAELRREAEEQCRREQVARERHNALMREMEEVEGVEHMETDDAEG